MAQEKLLIHRLGRILVDVQLEVLAHPRAATSNRKERPYIHVYYLIKTLLCRERGETVRIVAITASRNKIGVESGQEEKSRTNRRTQILGSSPSATSRWIVPVLPLSSVPSCAFLLVPVHACTCVRTSASVCVRARGIIYIRECVRSSRWQQWPLPVAAVESHRR